MAIAPRPAVLVIGEALMDITTTANGTAETPGGGPANVALGLGRRGVETTLLTSLGRDHQGLVITAHLEESNVGVLPESFSGRPTSTARATLDETGAASYEFDISWEIPAALSTPSPPVIHTGSLATFLAPGAESVRTLLAAHPDAIVTFDPNIRASLIGGVAEARSSFEDFARRSAVVKLSDEDAAFLYPGLDDADVVDTILALGPRLVAVTRGGAGASLATATDRVEVEAPRIDVADTIGAGDTFMASLLTESAVRTGARLSADDLAAIGRRAVAAAAVTVSRAGADLPWAEELAV
jgi:fructokinase